VRRLEGVYWFERVRRPQKARLCGEAKVGEDEGRGGLELAELWPAERNDGVPLLGTPSQHLHLSSPTRRPTQPALI
jgi:hypothetical protein